MTVTPRLGLNQPASTDMADVQSCLDDQLVKIDSAFDANVGNSLNKPINPYDGQLAFEFDTSHLLYYDAATTSWVLYSNGNKPLGRLGYVTTTSGGSNVSGTQEAGPFVSITFNAKVGRLYAIIWSTSISPVTGNNLTGKWVNVRASTSGPVTSSSTLVQKMIADVDDNGTGQSVRQIGSTQYYPNKNTVVTIGLFLQSTISNGTAAFNAGPKSTFAVEDIGYKG